MISIGLLLLLVGIVLAAIAVRRRTNRINTWGFVAPYAAIDVRQAGIHQFSSWGWRVTSHVDDTLTLSKSKGIQCGPFAVLFLLGVFPAIVYAIMARGEDTVSLTVRATDAGASHVQVSWSHSEGKDACWAFYRNIVQAG